MTYPDMQNKSSELRRAVHLMMNDVVEQCFSHMIHHPTKSEEINNIIRDASEEINYQVLKIDAHDWSKNEVKLQEHYRAISKDVQRKSLEMLSRLQRIQKTKDA